MEDRLLVCSLISAGKLNAFWLELQLDRLRRSVGDAFDHAVCLQKVEETLLTESIVVRNPPGGAGPLAGLQALRKYCLAHDYYKHYLFLSSDCFPIEERWLEMLCREMQNEGKTWAAVSAVERLQPEPQPIAFFTSDPSKISFAHQRSTWPGAPEEYVICSADRSEWLPLQRTNPINRHPVVGSIYGGLFYHHGYDVLSSGSMTDYYDGITEGYTDPEILTCKLVADPENYLRIFFPAV